jgi:peptide/nickel transport system permease protein
MKQLILKRLLLGLFTMWIVSLMIFASTEILPGDVAESILGKEAPPEVIAAMRDRLGLDQPAYFRYAAWVSNLAKGDLGTSLGSGRDISLLIGPRLWNTLFLAGITAVIAVPLSVLLGIVAATKAGSFTDRSISLGTLLTISVPEFFLAALLVFFFAVKLGWFPAIPNTRPGQSFGAQLHSLFLPILTLTLAIMAHIARMTRNAILSVLSASYIEMAILKGVPRYQIIVLHALPNALSPIINVIALNLAYLISGVVIVETVFSYPGVARLMVDAVATRDIPLIQVCGLIFCATYVLLNLVADILSILSNARLRSPK